jgi:hypothetical protein
VNAYGIHARISADKKYLVPCGFGWYRRLHSFAVYETATGKRVSEMLDVQGQLSGGDFSPDGSLFVSLATLEQHQETTRPADWHERQGVVRFWDWQQAKERLAPLRTPSEPLDVRFLSDDRAVVVCAAGHLLIVDLGSGKVAKTLQHPGEAIYYNPAERFLVVSPSGDRFVTCGLGPEAILWRAQDGEIVGALKHDSTVLSAAFGPEGRYVATGSMDAIARVWDASSGQPLSERLKHTDWIFHCRFSRDGRHLLTASRDYLARLWDWEQAALACPAFGHPDEVFTADFIPETPFIVTSSRFASARFWETHKGTPISPPIDVSGRGPPHRLYAVPHLQYFILCGMKVHALDYSDLAADEEESTNSLVLLAELVAAREIGESSGVVNLTTDAWVSKWRNYRSNTSPDFPSGVGPLIPHNRQGIHVPHWPKRFPKFPILDFRPDGQGLASNVQLNDDLLPNLEVPTER